jgi:hypothetical protein
MPSRGRRRLAALVLAAGAAFGSGAGTGASAAEREKERSNAPDAISVTARGIRYEAVHWGQARGLGQNGGYVQAVDAASGSVLWLHRSYRVEYDPAREQDKQDLFIAALTVTAGGGTLRIRDEHNRLYMLDLRNHRVSSPPVKGGAGNK